MCLNETYSRFGVGKHLSDMFPIRNGMKQRDAFNFALEFTIKRVQVNQKNWKFNGSHHLLSYADDVNILGGNIHSVEKNTQVLLANIKKISLEVNADKIKYMVMSRDQNARRSHDIKIDNSFFAKVEEFEYLETNLTVKILFSKKLRAE